MRWFRRKQRREPVDCLASELRRQALKVREEKDKEGKLLARDRLSTVLEELKFTAEKGWTSYTIFCHSDAEAQELKSLLEPYGFDLFIEAVLRDKVNVRW